VPSRSCGPTRLSDPSEVFTPVGMVQRNVSTAREVMHFSIILLTAVRRKKKNFVDVKGLKTGRVRTLYRPLSVPVYYAM
jgi:hypothetical protein